MHGDGDIKPQIKRKVAKSAKVGRKGLEGLTVGTHFQGVRLAKAPSFARHASSDEFKANLYADEELIETSRAWDASGTREIQERGWTRALAGALRAVGRTEAEAEAGRKSAPWKVAVAADLKATTQADNRWLAKRLHLRALNGVSFHTGQLRRGHLVGAPGDKMAGRQLVDLLAGDRGVEPPVKVLQGLQGAELGRVGAAGGASAMRVRF